MPPSDSARASDSTFVRRLCALYKLFFLRLRYAIISRYVTVYSPVFAGYSFRLLTKGWLRLSIDPSAWFRAEVVYPS